VAQSLENTVSYDKFYENSLELMNTLERVLGTPRGPWTTLMETSLQNDDTLRGLAKNPEK
jgi:hypothetical protein